MSTAKYYTEMLDPSQWEQWDDFVSNRGKGTIFQTSKYLNCVSAAFNRQIHVLTVRREQDIVGGVVLLPQKKLGIRYTTSPFYLPYNSFMVDSFAESTHYYRRVRYQRSVLEIMQSEVEKKYSFAEFAIASDLMDLRSLIRSKWKFTPDYSIVIKLDDKEELLMRMRRNQRRNLKSYRGNSSDYHETQDFNKLFELMKQSYKKHGLQPPLEKNVFIKFCKELILSGIGKCYALSNNGNLLSAIFILEQFPIAYALFAGRIVDQSRSDAEIYLYWKIMSQYKEIQYNRFDLLGAMVESIAHVKIGLGGQLFRYDKANFYRNRIVKLLYELQKARKSGQRIA